MWKSNGVAARRFERQQGKGMGRETGGGDGREEPTGNAEPFGRRQVDTAIQADDPAESAHGVAFVSEFERFGKIRADRASAGIVVLADGRCRSWQGPHNC